MEFRLHGANQGGSFGHVVAVLQVIGFVVGGFCVYAYLAAKPYCTKCSRYLSGKGKQTRYAKDPEGLQTATAQLAVHLANGDVRLAVEEHGNSAGFGASTIPKACRLRSVVEFNTARSAKDIGSNLLWRTFLVMIGRKSPVDQREIYRAAR